MASIFSEIVTGPSAWLGPDLTKDQSWIYELTRGDLAELEAALARVKAKRLAMADVRRSDFVLPSLGPKLAEQLEEVNNGRGFVVFRGLPVDRYAEEDTECILWGIGTHLGIAVTQNPRGELLGHVFDHGRKYGEIDVRGYETRAHLPFHTDSGDLIALLCLRRAKSGGLSSIVSSISLHNEILRLHPEYLPPLYRGFHYIRREAALGEDPVSAQRIPVFGCAGGLISCRLIRNQINAACEKMGKPLGALEREALDFLASLANSPEYHLDMDLQLGDIQVCNNYTILHSRTEFEDWPEPGRGRHMLRLWLSARNRRPLAPEFPQHNGYGQIAELAFQTEREMT
jgi:TfdA family taurine catabolism dioxygenase TauD